MTARKKKAPEGQLGLAVANQPTQPSTAHAQPVQAAWTRAKPRNETQPRVDALFDASYEKLLTALRGAGKALPRGGAHASIARLVNVAIVTLHEVEYSSEVVAAMAPAVLAIANAANAIARTNVPARPVRRFTLSTEESAALFYCPSTNPMACATRAESEPAPAPPATEPNDTEPELDLGEPEQDEADEISSEITTELHRDEEE